MAQIKVDNGETFMDITIEEAMKWYCWHELIHAMEKDRKSLDMAVDSVPHEFADWELRVLKKFLELTKHDLIIE